MQQAKNGGKTWYLTADEVQCLRRACPHCGAVPVEDTHHHTGGRFWRCPHKCPGAEDTLFTVSYAAVPACWRGTHVGKGQGLFK